MKYKDYKKIEEMNKRCQTCVWLVNNGGIYYCPFARCFEQK